MFQLRCCFFHKDDCWYAHISPEAEKGLKLTICEEFSRAGKCGREADCPEAHGKQELYPLI